jgi:hypothetical protein
MAMNMEGIGEEIDELWSWVFSGEMQMDLVDDGSVPLFMDWLPS